MRIGRFLSVTQVQSYIVAYHLPALLLIRNNQVIPNNDFTDISFSGEVYDELDMWTIGEPTKIYTPSDAIWTITVFVAWASDNTGYRSLIIGGLHLPAVSSEFKAVDAAVHEDGFSTVLHVDSSEPVTVRVLQNSGGNLTLTTVSLLMLRHVEMVYPT